MERVLNENEWDHFFFYLITCAQLRPAVGICISMLLSFLLSFFFPLEPSVEMVPSVRPSRTIGVGCYLITRQTSSPKTWKKKGVDVMWHGSIPAEAGPSAPSGDKQDPLHVLIDVSACGYRRPCSLPDRNKQRGVLCYSRSFHALLLPPNALPPFSQPLVLSHLGCPRLNRDESGSAVPFGYWVLKKKAHSSATLTKILVRVRLRLDLQ